MLESKFKNLLAFLKNKNILIITHEPADVDGLGSCFALKEFLEQYFQKKVRIYLSEMTRLAKSVLAKIKLKFPDNDFYLEEDVKLSLIDVILILDTNNLDLLNCVGVDTVPHVFIDHHLWANEEDGKNLDSLNIIMENYTSTAEVIFEIYQNTQVSIPDHVKWLVLSSILTDSGFFKYANNNTLTRFTSILGDTIDIQEIYSFLKIEEEFSEKMARIKGLQRLEIIRENQILIGLSKVSNYESNVANSLINIGFDISMVLSNRKKDLRITMRAKKEITASFGLNLGKILKDVANNFDGSAGGHEGAASISNFEDIEIIKEEVLKKIRQIIND